MKKRHGFVSNSSSSSFVMAYDKEMYGCPKNMDEDDITLYRDGLDCGMYYPLNDEMREYLRNHPDDAEYNVDKHYKGLVLLSEDFDISEKLMGKHIHVKTFGNDCYEDRMAESVEDFFDEE